MDLSTGDRVRVTEVRFAITDPSYRLVEATQRASCRFELRDLVPHEGGRFAEFFTLTGADPERVLAIFDEREELDAALFRTIDGCNLIEILVGEDCPVVSLARQGGIPRLVTAEAGVVRLVAEIPPTTEPTAVVEGFLDDNPTAELTAKRQRARLRSLFAPGDFERAVRCRLTERQYEVIQTAFEEGYYEWPREHTGEDIADDLGITSATFSQHVAMAERKLLAVLFEDGP